MPVGWAILQKPPVNTFEQIKNTSQFNEDFVKNYNKKVMKNIFLKLISKFRKFPENLHNVHNYLALLPERIKVEKAKKLVAKLHDKNEQLLTKEI